MMRIKALLLIPAAAVAAALGWRTQQGSDTPGVTPEVAVAAAAEPRGAGSADPRVDSARIEAAAGRAWHAATLLRAAASGGPALAPDDVLMLARSDLAWRNWAGVVEQLAGKPWLDRTADGEGWMLLGRAREERKEWVAAAEAYDRWFATRGASAEPLAQGIRARQALALAQAGRPAEALAALDKTADAPVVMSWASLDPASIAADSGRVEQVRALLARVTDSIARLQGWELVPRALLAAGDSASAEAAYREAAGSVVGDNRRTRAWSIVGDLSRGRRDDAGARTAYVSALKASIAAPAAARAAKALLEMGSLDADQALLVAQALGRANDDPAALQAYDVHVQAKGGAQGVDETIRLDRARILVGVKGREIEAVEELRALSASTRERVGAPALDLWADLRQKQGRAADLATLQQQLVDRFPTSPEAADVVFFKGDVRHDKNDLEGAAAEYRKLVAMAPATDRGGLAAMRTGQIHLLHNEAARAAEVYEKYLGTYPTGRRWQESSYWAARAHLSHGDTAKARSLIGRLQKDDPFSYYTMIGADLLGETYKLDLPAGDVIETPAWLSEGILRVDQLHAGGLDTGAAAEVDRLTARAKAGGPGTLEALGYELLERDRTIEAINLAFEARRQNAPWTLRLARLVYPWGYREVFQREAREDGVDPFLTAALARQESAFDPDVHSAARAVGLMQLLPEVGAEVAAKVGPAGFRPELLEVPDVNVHLGTLHLRDLLKNYDGDMTRFLSAYNAGAHRVVRWVDFAEAKDPLTFTERIPFAETRDYVKQIHRNLVLYRLLYGNG
ncbi:MAG: tetratricopeptide repeat protein [Gemmatimonadetes bacterium]|nr:tetratricopeptide repeat protein [Gemmatimonadota bacterium]